MILTSRKAGRAWPTSSSWEEVSAVAVKLDNGMTLTIRQTENGAGFVVSESTHFHVAVHPRAANSIEVHPVDPEQFVIGKELG